MLSLDAPTDASQRPSGAPTEEGLLAAARRACRPPRVPPPPCADRGSTRLGQRSRMSPDTVPDEKGAPIIPSTERRCSQRALGPHRFASPSHGTSPRSCSDDSPRSWSSSNPAVTGERNVCPPSAAARNNSAHRTTAGPTHPIPASPECSPTLISGFSPYGHACSIIARWAAAGRGRRQLRTREGGADCVGRNIELLTSILRQHRR